MSPQERDALCACILEVLSPQPSPLHLAREAADQLSRQPGAEGKDALTQGIPSVEKEQQEAKSPPLSQEVRLRRRVRPPSLFNHQHLHLPFSYFF